MRKTTSTSLMAMGECLANSGTQTDSKVKLAAWPMGWRPPGAG